MSTYYELLKVEKNASHAEIEATLDDQYTKWRSLVTHHEPEVVSQANQALQLLEEMRAILLDPGKRSAYDAAITSQQEGTAGLADPEMILAANPMGAGGMAPPRPRQVQQPEHVIDRTDAWICKQCNKANVIGTQYCAKCGTRIALDCPSCGSLAEFSNKFCSNCGVEKFKAFKESQTRQIKDLEQRIRYKNQELQEAESQPGKFAKAHDMGNISSCTGSIFSLLLIIVAASVGFAAESFGSFFFIFFLGLIGFAFINNLMRKQATDDYIRDIIKPEINNLQKEIKRIQKSTYGAN